MSTHELIFKNIYQLNRFLQPLRGSLGRSLRDWYGQLIMMDDPYEEAEQQQLREKFLREDLPALAQRTGNPIGLFMTQSSGMRRITPAALRDMPPAVRPIHSVNDGC
jgi:hypothetical protein